MKLWQRRIPVDSRSDIIYLHLFSDVHIGHRGCDEKLFRKKLKIGAKKKNHYYLFCGDCIDAIGKKDPRFLPSSIMQRVWMPDETDDEGEIKPVSKKQYADCIIDASIDVFCDYVEEDLDAKQILGVMEGNHEGGARKYLDTNPTQRIVDRFNRLISEDVDPFNKIPNLGYQCFYRLLFQRSGQVMAFDIFAMHGFGGGGRTAGGTITKYDKHGKQYLADLKIYGHSHDPQAHEEVLCGLAPKKLELKMYNSYIVCLPTFLKTLSNNEIPFWAEERGFPLRPLGNKIVMIKPDWDNLEFEIGETKFVA